MTHRVERIGACELHLGDCREVLPMLAPVDAVVTDPPYGVNFDGKMWHSTERGKTVKSTAAYEGYQDTPENFSAVVLPAISLALSLARSGLVFMSSSNVQLLPSGEVGGIYLPSGTGSGSWGFQSFMHAVFYGKDPYLASGMGRRPTGKYGIYGNDSNRVDHPCAKPLAAMLWAVNRASLPDASVLDPFMGSGTTGVACVRLGRKFVGVEIDPGYFATACRRIEAATKQPDLFIEQPAPKAEQLSLV